MSEADTHLLEFGAESQFQLSHDALKAFPAELQEKAEIFYWPVEKRELNLFGKPGKLHAKAAVIDKHALLSSANLTGDAFLRNLELGVLFMGGDMPTKLRNHFDHLIVDGTLLRWSPELASHAVPLHLRDPHSSLPPLRSCSRHFFFFLLFSDLNPIASKCLAGFVMIFVESI